MLFAVQFTKWDASLRWHDKESKQQFLPYFDDKGKTGFMQETTIDKLLGGRFEVEQPAKGYRIAVDTLLLAAAVPAQGDQRVLELGCGVGGVMLALAARLDNVRITGLEILPVMADLCASNIQRNKFDERLCVVKGDVAALPDRMREAFDHVMMNPPYHDGKTHIASGHTSKRVAHMESDDADLALWVKTSFDALKEGGVLTLIHRADRLDEIVGLLSPLFSAISIKPIQARPEKPAKRVIVRGVKGSGPKTKSTQPSLILYNEDGRYAEEAEDILRRACGLPW